MRRLALALVVLCLAPSVARAQGENSFVQGFGGLTFGGSSTWTGPSTASALGGVVAAGLTPNIQIVGEFGRLSDVTSPVFDLLDLASVDLHVSAWYGQGGVRLIAGPQSAVRPYAEATAGVARLSTGLSGLGVADAFIDTALPFLNRTEPMLGAGGGVVLQAGRLAVDVGYRYKRIVASGLPSALNGGSAYQVNEARVGVGIRF